jgi:predicted transcriptional regulator
MDKWKMISFVSSSQSRKQLLIMLRRLMTPTQISNELKVSVAHVSRTLRELRQKGLVELLTPDQRVHKIYRTTASGKKISIEIEKFEKENNSS